MLDSARDGKQYGSLLAGYATLLDAKPVTQETAREYVEKVHLTAVVDENRDTTATGWSECWAKMCAVMLTFRDSRSRVTVGEAVEMLQSNNLDDLAGIAGYVAGVLKCSIYLREFA